MTERLHPTENQRRFFKQHVLGEELTILTLKVRRRDSQGTRGFSVNIRGPFKLAEYTFPSGQETVIDATWATDKPESESHFHVCWTEVRFAKLSETNRKVRDNIDYNWELAFFVSEEDAKLHDPSKDDRRLFWFYLKDEYHKAVQNLQSKKGQLLPVE